jgi:hypothetical protein
MRSIHLLLAAAFSVPASAGVIVLEGNYQGKNLFIQNPSPKRVWVSVCSRSR